MYNVLTNRIRALKSTVGYILCTGSINPLTCLCAGSINSVYSETHSGTVAVSRSVGVTGCQICQRAMCIQCTSLNCLCTHTRSFVCWTFCSLLAPVYENMFTQLACLAAGEEDVCTKAVLEGLLGV